MPGVIDLIGKIFGHWKVIKQDLTVNIGAGAFWICECNCENKTIKTIDGAFLRRGSTTHCGCQLKAKNMSQTPEYHCWTDIKQRCYNENNQAYNDYGGREIKVCNRWLESFQNFYEDMGKVPFHGATIDRINVNGNYELNNCKWSSREEQNRNRTYNKIKNKEQADKIREEFKKGNKTRATIAREYGFKPHIVECIIKNETWT